MSLEAKCGAKIPSHRHPSHVQIELEAKRAAQIAKEREEDVEVFARNHSPLPCETVEVSAYAIFQE